jgi:hypothetical protein
MLLDNDEQAAQPTYRIAMSRFALAEKIGRGDPFWSTFNASFCNKHISANDLANHIYAGFPFTTWHRNQWRENKNFECGQHIGLDFDTMDLRSTLAELKQDHFIAKYASLIYTTISHKPEAPRARTVFLLDTPIMQGANYALAVQAMLWVFGTADPQCREPARFFYGAQNCEIEYMENVLPLEKVKELIARYQVSGQREKRSQGTPGTPAEMSEVEDALAAIDPWSIDYGSWLRILMALHAEYGDTALSLAVRWGKGDDDEIERKWKRFNGGGNTTGAVTIRTMFDIAIQKGWRKV